MQPETKKNNFLIIGLVILFIIIIIGLLASKTSPEQATIPTTEINNNEDRELIETENINESNEQSQNTPTTQNEEEDISSESSNSSKGIYTDYSATAVANSDAENIILFFNATWCPSCHALDKDIKANLSSIPEDTEIYKVDYDTSLELRKRYSVTTQHTLVQIDKEGNLIKKWDNSMTLDSLVTKI